MANPKHLALIGQSTTLWNEWTQKHPELQPDLRKASLQGMQLEGVNLAEFVLSTHDEATRRSLLFCIRWKVSLSSSQHPTPG